MILVHCILSRVWNASAQSHSCQMSTVMIQQKVKEISQYTWLWKQLDNPQDVRFCISSVLWVGQLIKSEKMTKRGPGRLNIEMDDGQTMYDNRIGTRTSSNSQGTASTAKSPEQSGFGQRLPASLLVIPASNSGPTRESNVLTISLLWLKSFTCDYIRLSRFKWYFVAHTGVWLQVIETQLGPV